MSEDFAPCHSKNQTENGQMSNTSIFDIQRVVQLYVHVWIQWTDRVRFEIVLDLKHYFIYDNPIKMKKPRFSQTFPYYKAIKTGMPQHPEFDAIMYLNQVLSFPRHRDATRYIWFLKLFFLKLRPDI